MNSRTQHSRLVEFVEFTYYSSMCNHVSQGILFNSADLNSPQKEFRSEKLDFSQSSGNKDIDTDKQAISNTSIIFKYIFEGGKRERL